MEFEKIKRVKFQRKSAIVADQILKMIKNGDFKSGAKIPPERALAEQMGVGRPSIREAISALQIVGILESRPGDGSYVTDPGGFDDHMIRALHLLEESQSPLELLQTRKALEIGIVHLAIKKARDKDIQAIKEAWRNKYEKGRSGHHREFILYGREFHLAIARATHSPSIVALLDELIKLNQQPLFLNMREAYLKADPLRIELMMELHANIVKAIEERNSRLAIHWMEEHFEVNIRQHYFDGDNL